MFLQFGEFLPDQPNFANPGTDIAYNVLPRTQQSYGPFPSMMAYSSNGLGSRCQGALAALDNGGNVSIFAGDTQDIFKLSSGSLAWSSVSKSAHAYTPDSGGRWAMCQFGQQILATDYNDAIQAFTLNVSAAFADLGGTPPKAKDICIAKNFVMLGFTNDGVNGVKEQRLWWSAINNSGLWPTPGTSAALAVQSDFQDFPGDHGWLQRVIPNLGFADVAVFFERAIWRGQYVGGSFFWSFAPAEKIRGTPAPNSVIQIGSFVFYLGEDGFYKFDGANSTAIGSQKVDKFFYSDAVYAVDQNYMDRISATVDPINKIVLWAYPDANATSGRPNRILAYHYGLDRWSFIKDQETELLFRAFSIGYTLDALASLYGTLDAVPFSLDSRVWTGGKTLLAGFDSSHKLGYFNGTNLAPQIETSEAKPFPTSRARVSKVTPIVDAGTPSCSIGHRTRPMDSLVYSTAVAMNVLGDCPVDVDDEMIRVRLTLPAGTSFIHLQGVEVDAMPSSNN